MGFMIGGLIATAAKGIFSSVIETYSGDVKEVALNAARDTVERIVTGRRSLDDWSEISIAGVDTIKNRAIDEEGLTYVGGKLMFSMSPKRDDKVIISFELYFQDDQQQWHKVGAESDLFASNFTLEALEEIESEGSVSFEVE